MTFRVHGVCCIRLVVAYLNFSSRCTYIFESESRNLPFNDLFHFMKTATKQLPFLFYLFHVLYTTNFYTDYGNNLSHYFICIMYTKNYTQI